MLNVLEDWHMIRRIEMSNLKLCQGTSCHTYYTQDRLKGSKDNKTYQTRRRSRFYYGGGNFCSLNCQNDWFNDFGNKAIDHFGRLTEPKKLTEENAWTKRYRWEYERRNGEAQHYYYNMITNEQRPITQEQYEDSNYTLNTN
jgi:hypothetical protein